MKFTKIDDVKYSVKIKLDEYLRHDQARSFKDQLGEIRQHDNDFKKVYELQGNTLEYFSETLLPRVDDHSKEKVLLIFGNPAIHSVKNGMFFFSRNDSKRHPMWGKLSKANMMHEFKSKKKLLLKAREEEAKKHKEMIITGTSSNRYIVGLTTFFSFPTPVAKGFKFSNVSGVERIFAPMLKILVRNEIKRIKSYSFFENAKLIFVQKSTYKAFREASNITPLFWPIRGKGSSGQALSDLMQSHNDSRNTLKIKTFQLFIGGYFGPSYSLELKGHEIIYKTFGEGYELVNTELIIPTMDQLEQFQEEINTIGIWYWNKRYINQRVLDGESWSVSFVCEGKSFKSSGSNAYPERFDEFKKSVRKLVKNRPFQ